MRSVLILNNNALFFMSTVYCLGENETGRLQKETQFPAEQQKEVPAT